jgi:hypothetical protein
VGGSEGKVLGGRIKVIRLADGAVLAEGVTDSVQGLTTLRWCKADMPVMLEMRGAPGARYFDEAVNDLVDFPLTQKLRALVDRFDENVGVSALTEAAYLYAMNNIANDPAPIKAGAKPVVSDGVPVGMTASQVSSANAVVLAELNRHFTDSLQQASVKSLATPVDQFSDTAALPRNRYGRIGAITGGFAKIAKSYNFQTGVPALKFSVQFGLDMTDGRINGYSLNGAPMAALAERTFHSTVASENWTLGQGLMSAQFGQSTTALDAEQTLTSTNASGYSPECPTELISGSYFLSKSGVVSALMTIPPACQAAGNGAQSRYVDQLLTGVRTLSNYTVEPTVFAIKTDGTVYAWGQGQCGSLGTGALGERFAQRPELVPGLQHVVNITGTGGAFLALTSEGDVYIWGRNFANILLPLGLPYDGTCVTAESWSGTVKYENFLARPRKITSLKDIKFITADFSSITALDTQGRLFVLGESMLDAVFGHAAGTTYNKYSSFQTNFNDIVKTESLVVAALALRRDGTVWSWADPLLGGALFGFGDFQTPKKVNGIVDAVDILTNGANLISLDSRGEVAITNSACHGVSGLFEATPISGRAFPVRSASLQTTLPRAVRLMHLGSRLGFVGADGLFYVFNIAPEDCSWQDYANEQLAAHLAQGVSEIALPKLLGSARCDRRTGDFICQEFNGDRRDFDNYGGGFTWFSTVTYGASPLSQALLLGRGQDFTIEYRLDGGFPKSGTVEMQVMVTGAYEYSNGAFAERSCAPLFLTDWADVTWPGSTWFLGCSDGRLILDMSTEKYGANRQRLEVNSSQFKFGQWVRVGFSYGQFGQSISVNGVTIASNAGNTQQLGSGGTHEAPSNVGTIGKFRSKFFPLKQFDVGVDGAVDWIRVSPYKNDWVK